MVAIAAATLWFGSWLMGQPLRGERLTGLLKGLLLINLLVMSLRLPK